MTIDVLYVTYAKDAEWFRLSLQVLWKNLKGWRQIHIVCPQQDFEVIDRAAGNHLGPFPRFQIHPIPDWKGQGYHWQQWVKMNADSYSDADLIFHIDSDAYVKRPTDVQDFFRDGKPGWLWAYYTDLGNTVPWQTPTKRATALACPQEFMCGFPFIIHRSTYAKAREHMERTHIISLEGYIRSAAERGQTSFSEFNVLGRVAWEYEREKYAWIDRNREEWPPGFHASRQFWSRAPISDHIAEINAMLGAPEDPQSIRCTKMGHWIPSYDTHIGKWVEDAGRLDCDGYLLPRILPLIKPGDVVIDVGANIGDHTHAYAKAVLGDGVDTGRVLAFEPNPVPFECLMRNMRGHGHVECIPKGLSNLMGFGSIVQSSNVGASHVIGAVRVDPEGVVTIGDDQQHASIELTTLDSYHLGKCDLIKIDAEGFEYAILQGAWETITKCRPIIVMEINKGALARNGVMPEDIYNWMALRGYEVRGVEPGEQFDIFCMPQ